MKPLSTTSWLRFLVQLQFLFLVKADLDPFGYIHDGCYSGLDNFVNMGQSASMSSYYCMNLCTKKGYSVAAATDPGICYCGNSIPGTQLPSSDCNFPCPAYPQEPCGGPNGAYNIFHVGDDVTTASPVSSSTSAPSSTSQSSTEALSSSTTESSSSPPSSSSSTTSAESKTTSPTAPQSSNGSAGGKSATSEHSMQVSTATATVTNSVTASVTSSTATPSTTAGSHAQKKEGGGGISGGAIAGIVVGVVVGVGAVAGIIAFILIRRRKEEFYSPQSSPSRFNDSSGFHGGYNPNYPVIDQRLNPDLLGGDHRISIASLVDARDYSRQILKVVNPDDEKY
ncbi:hypothetical protein B9G98_03554 [Wickerhamiella sorbophila]|uniref:WSC domain-containing protein n=1 Tax=Wickerhamiella sorbophila TaxID=45607 RepID=A0A2T0FLS1_9ASCO|nr:hypothetical protein B9G98_03554 [Wickerhamiella sorbophila]PRT55934.1 hypothetical protein B9G98_03554 [Wickerhamiella sorbophila]